MEEEPSMGELTPAARTSTADIMAVQIRPGAEAPDGTAVIMAGMEGIGVIRGTGMDGAGVLALAGRLGVGDTRMATTGPARGTLLPILPIIRTPVLRDIHVPRMGAMTLRHLIRAQNRESTQQGRGDRP